MESLVTRMSDDEFNPGTRRTSRPAPGLANVCAAANPAIDAHEAKVMRPSSDLRRGRRFNVSSQSKQLCIEYSVTNELFGMKVTDAQITGVRWEYANVADESAPSLGR